MHTLGFKDMRAYYASVLGISPEAGEAEIKSAYRRMVKKFHPDINPQPNAQERFLEIKKAYDYLLAFPYAAFTGAENRPQTAEAKRAEERNKKRDMRRQRADAMRKQKEVEEAEIWEKFKKSKGIWILVFVVMVAYFVIMGACIKNIDDYPYENVKNPELGLFGSVVVMFAFSYLMYRFYRFIRS